ncbi:MAG: RagB/SusD family nutrient uptake outer membrane protein [Bacteroidota bacterium]
MKMFKNLLLALVLLSCSDSLELLPEDTLTPEVFYSNPSNLPAGLVGIYDAAQGIFNNMPLLEGITDNGICYNFSQDYQGFGQGTLTPVSVTFIIIREYQGTFTLIHRANLLLANIDVPVGITDEERETIRYEARALRAIAYMRLVYLFGDVPFYTTPLTREEILNISRTDRNEVLEFVIDELTEATEMLEPAPFNGNAGRLTSIATSAFLARIYLYEARLGNIGWQQARSVITDALLLAEANGIDLFLSGDGLDGQANYQELFYENNEDNSEIIWAVKYDVNDASTSKAGNFLPVAGTLDMTILQELVDSYYTVDGLPITSSNSIFNPNSPYENRDPRLQATVIVPGAEYSDGFNIVSLTENANPVSRTPFYLRKFTTLNGEIELDEGRLDAIIIRHSDLLLMLAESENEVNGPTGIAQNAFNRVRDRVLMPRVSTNISQDDFRSEIIHERRVELAFEESRWFDLVTLGIAEERIDGIGNDEVLMRDFVPNKQELFPIPQTEIDLNQNLQQNPGY